ncbi:MAG: hypothetical protein ACOH2V_00720 [Candidatus Saccharimonadaceae bacterium]
MSIALTEPMPEKVLIQYKRNSKNQLTGVMISTGPGIVGWSLCSKRDNFDKNHGLNIALRRVFKSAMLSTLEKKEYYSKCPASLQDLLTNMLNRSYLYFKIPDDTTFDF